MGWWFFSPFESEVLFLRKNQIRHFSKRPVEHNRASFDWMSLSSNGDRDVVCYVSPRQSMFAFTVEVTDILFKCSMFFEHHAIHIFDP